MKEYALKSGSENKSSEINIIKEIWSKEQALKENLLLTVEKFLSEFAVRIFVEKSSDFNQQTPPVRTFQAIGSRLAEFIPHRACSGAGLGG